MPQSKAARANMITGQIMTGDVNDDNVINALESVDRSAFVPDKLKQIAYIDEDIALGGGRFLLEPLIFARLLKYAAISPKETVLDVGCATGYSAAVIAKLAAKVVALEEEKALAAKAKTLLSTYLNIECVEAPLLSGAADKAPYDVILVEGAIAVMPQAFSDQLNEGGRLLTIEHVEAPKTAGSGLGKLVEYRKIRGSLYRTVLHDANAHLIPGFKSPERFVF